jgi:hypothetical protein
VAEIELPPTGPQKVIVAAGTEPPPKEVEIELAGTEVLQAEETGSQSIGPVAEIGPTEIVPVVEIISTLATTTISMSMHGAIQW